MIGVGEGGGDGTGCAWVGGRVGCILAKGGADHIDTHACTRGATVGVDAWIFNSFSELKLSARSSWGIF